MEKKTETEFIKFKDYLQNTLETTTDFEKGDYLTYIRFMDEILSSHGQFQDYIEKIWSEERKRLLEREIRNTDKWLKK